MAQKPGIPKGTRDFSPADIAKRNYIINTIRTQFELFGFLPIETPAFENLETLLGKYGEEGDRLIFKILNSGDYIARIPPDVYASGDPKLITPHISQRALRYDLTVPFARYVVTHQNELNFPFKRYQIQPVWRADRPQKGRFREFYQCDADVVGSKSPLQEIEFITLYDKVFHKLGLNEVRIKINHRKILSGIAQLIGAGDQLTDFTVALDKIDKIGMDGVLKEMREKGFSEETLERARPFFFLKGDNDQPLEQLQTILKNSDEGLEGIKELRHILDSVSELGLQAADIELDLTLARGLNYYTGIILEVGAPEGVAMGSIGGGGRYDDLTGIFGLKGVSGIGISFGLERIYLVMEELNLFPESLTRDLDVLCLNFGEEEALESMKLIRSLREEGVKADFYPDSVKIQKQMKYANNRGVPYVILMGDRELASKEFVVKDMRLGDQKTYSLSQVAEFARSL